MEYLNLVLNKEPINRQWYQLIANCIKSIPKMALEMVTGQDVCLGHRL